MNKRSDLFFNDIVLLKVIEQNATGDFGVIYTKIPELCNAWLRKREVPINYCDQFSAVTFRIQGQVHVLTDLGFIRRISARRGFCATDKGKDFLAKLGDEWRDYPLAIPINELKLDLEHAMYAADFREEL